MLSHRSTGGQYGPLENKSEPEGARLLRFYWLIYRGDTPGYPRKLPVAGCFPVKDIMNCSTANALDRATGLMCPVEETGLAGSERNDK